jgi:hypothetical protein
MQMKRALALVVCSTVLGCSGGKSSVAPPAPVVATPQPAVTTGVKGSFGIGQPQLHFSARSGGGYTLSHANYQVDVDASGSWTLRAAGIDTKSGHRVNAAPIAFSTIAAGGADASSLAVALAPQGHLTVDRGVAVEKLESSPEGVEQSWRFDQRPGNGDLVVRVSTAGHPLKGSDGDGLHFVDPATGIGVRYGLATWVDAHGVRTTVAPRFADGEIVLTVPAAVAASSAYPAVLDPLAGPEKLIDDSVHLVPTAAVSQVHGAWDGNNFIVTWPDGRDDEGQSPVAISSRDVFAEQVSAAGSATPAAGIVVSHTERRPGDRIGIACDPATHNCLLAWQSEGTSSGHTGDIHARRLLNGVVQGSPGSGNDIVISSNGTGFNPAVAFNATSSTFVVAWQDHRSGPQAAWANTYTTAGGPGTEQLIGPGAGEQDLQIASSNSDNLLVVWTDTTGGHLAVRGVRIDHTLASLGAVDIATTGGYDQRNPSVGFSGGNYGVDWVDFRSGGSEIYGKLIQASDGSTVNVGGQPDFGIATGAATRDVPAAGGNPDGFLFAWIDGGSSTKFRRYDSSGGALAGAADLGAPSIYPFVAASTDHFLEGAAGAAPTSQPLAHGILSATGADSFAEEAIGSRSNNQTWPAVAANATGSRWLTVWSDDRASGGTHPNIHGAFLDNSGNVIGPGLFTVSSDTAGSGQFSPRVIYNVSTDSYLVVWVDFRNGLGGDLYGARINFNDTTPVPTTDVQINAPGDFVESVGGEVDVAANGSGFVVVWDGNHLNAAFLDANVAVSSGPFEVVAQTGRTPRVTCDGASTCLVVWQDSGADIGDIWGQVLNSSTGAAPDTTGFAIATQPNLQQAPTVTFGGTRYFVAWQDGRSGFGFSAFNDIYASRVTTTAGLAHTVVDSGGVAISPIGGNDKAYPQAVFDGTDFLVAWVRGLGGVPLNSGFHGSLDVYGTRISQTMSVLTDAFVIEAGGTHWAPGFASDHNGNALVAYSEFDTSGARSSLRVRGNFVYDLANGQSCVGGDPTSCASGNCVGGTCCFDPCVPTNHVLTTTCATGTACGIGTCASPAPGGSGGFLDCDNSFATGCEANSNIDQNNCGGCGSSNSHFVCAGAPHVTTASCTNGTCGASTCAPTFIDCNGDKSVGGLGCECGASDACHTPSCTGAACGPQVNTAACSVPVCGLGAPPPGCATLWADSDGDGLSDAWETAGCVDMNCNNSCADSVDIPLPGASTSVKDIYIRYDFMGTPTASGIGTPAHSHQPPAAVLTQVQQAFAAHNINLHWIAPPPASISCPSGFCFSTPEHQVATRDSAPSGSCAGADFVTMQTLRSNAFGAVGPLLGPNFQHPAYHYLVFAHNATLPDTALDGSACPIDAECGGHPDPTSSGSSDVFGDDIIVAFGYNIDLGIPVGIETFAGTTLHEIGHNLGLKHGSLAAPAPQTCLLNKPNFVSVMDYSYQSGIGVSTASGNATAMTCTSDANCNTGVCATAGACHCTDDLAPNTCYRVDYSNNTLLTLTESSLNEGAGVGGPAGDQDIVVFCHSGVGCSLYGPSVGGINWNNSDGSTETGISADIAGTGAATLTLNTTTDWNLLQFGFQCSSSWGAGAPGDNPSVGTYEQGVAAARAQHSAYPPFTTRIDIRPGCGTNWIAIGAAGPVPVAIFGAANFAVSSVDLTSLRLDGVAATSTSTSDVDGDGFTDLVATFPMASLPVTGSTTSLRLSGWQTNTRAFNGIDSITIVPQAGPTVTIHNDGTGYSRTISPANNYDLVTYTLNDCVDTVIDNCGNSLSPNAVGQLIKITSDENSPLDMGIVGTATFQVRRQRDGGGDGRVYTAYFNLSDSYGDITSASCKIQMKHDNGGPNAIDSGAHSCVGSCP